MASARKNCRSSGEQDGERVDGVREQGELIAGVSALAGGDEDVEEERGEGGRGTDFAASLALRRRQ